MFTTRSCDVPAESLLLRYAGSGGYADCYVAELPVAVSHAQFVEAFYTSTLFKFERFVLRLLVARPSTDVQVKQLASGELGSFAAWAVEARAPNQLLLCDVAGRTRSWLMVAPGGGVTPSTKLFFGSAVVPARNKATGRTSMGFTFRALLGFHKLYSRALLGAARSRLAR